MSIGRPDFLAELNEQQRQAVTHTEGPLLIIAGAGSGKTRVLTYRIAYILQQQRALPQQILALTFTNKAAREMQERISMLLPNLSTRLWMGTFHSIFAKILRTEGTALGYTANFSIYDTSDTETVIKRILTELNYDPKLIRPRTIQRRISDAKNQLIYPDHYKEKFVMSKLDQVTSEVYEVYEQRLLQANALDFDDLLIKPVRLFEEHPDRLRKYQELFRYIMIDEYQDTNHAQYRVTKLLADLHQNICVVGDDAQSIYSFRGADIRNILDFKNDYEKAKEIPLEQNYRSTKAILRCADSIIKRNQKQLPKTLWTDNSEGETILYMEHLNEREEALRIARKIESIARSKSIPYNDIAVLYRTNYQSRVFEEAFRREGIPYQLVGGLSFYQRKEIKDVLAYLTLLVNPEDEQSLLRIINEPSRGIGSKTLQELLNHSRATKQSVWSILQRVGEDESISIPRPAVGRIQEFVGMIESGRSGLDGEEHILDVVRNLLDKSGYMRALVEENSHESMMRRENIIELQNAIAYYQEQNPKGKLSTFLQEISLITDSDKYDENKPAVTLMTIHASKGLEFPVVCIVGLEEDLFPIGGRDGEETDIEEERRLFYVAITRAQKELVFSSCQVRYRFGDETVQLRSRFLDEVDPGVVRTETGATIRQQQYRFESSAPAGRSSSGFSSSSSTSTSRALFGAASGIGSENSGSGTVTGDTSGYVHADYEDAYEPAEDGYTDDPFQAGAQVVHPKFGSGKILSRSGRGTDSRVVIFFPEFGQKTLMLRVAKLRIPR